MVKKTSSKKSSMLSGFPQTNEDLKNAVLLVSLFINLLVLVTWLVVRIDNSMVNQLTWLIK
ncbi:MAG: hypothetical protein WAW60_01520 [Candidatus Saccharimonadales bacterium]